MWSGCRQINNVTTLPFTLEKLVKRINDIVKSGNVQTRINPNEKSATHNLVRHRQIANHAALNFLVSGLAQNIPGKHQARLHMVQFQEARQLVPLKRGFVAHQNGESKPGNVGFGVPDVGHAVWLARGWSNLPPLTILTIADNQPRAIPDEGLRVEVSGTDIPPALVSLPAFPTFAPHPDQPTMALPLADAGMAATVPPLNLTNQGALILLDPTPFATKIGNAAQAGAAFAVIYNATNGSGFNLGLVAGTEYSPIPAVFIGHSAGVALNDLFQTNASALARLRLVTADKVFHVNTALRCEQVGVRVRTDHPLRGDLRITVRSPGGTRSVLQHFNDDTEAGPTDWTYWSTHHFLESSFGDWTVSVSDEFAGAVGNILSVSLILRGTQLADSDHDGLDDTWETNRLGSLVYGPKDDPDGDGFTNAREQIMGTDPQASDILAAPDLSRWGLFGSSYMRLSWPSAAHYLYEIQGGTNVSALNLITNLPGAFPESSLFVPYSATENGFFKVRAWAAP